MKERNDLATAFHFILVWTFLKSVFERKNYRRGGKGLIKLQVKSQILSADALIFKFN